MGLWARGSVAIVQTVRLPSVRLVRPRGFASFIVGLQIVSSLLEQEALCEVLVHSTTKRDGMLNLSPLIGWKTFLHSKLLKLWEFEKGARGGGRIRTDE